MIEEQIENDGVLRFDTHSEEANAAKWAVHRTRRVSIEEK